REDRAVVDLAERIHRGGGGIGVGADAQGGLGDVQGAIDKGDGVVVGGQAAGGDHSAADHVGRGGAGAAEGQGAAQDGGGLAVDEARVADGEGREDRAVV